MCGNLEDYVSTTAKISKSQSKDYEKILKVGLKYTLWGKEAITELVTYYRP